MHLSFFDAIKKSNTLRTAILVGKWEEIVGKVHKISEVVGIKERVLYVKVCIKELNIM